MSNQISTFVHYFDIEVIKAVIISNEMTSYFLLFFISILIALESLKPRRPWSKTALKNSYLSNTGLFIFNQILYSLLSISTLLIFAERISTAGVLHQINNSSLQLVITLLWLDFMYYIWHKMNHNFDCFWRFHKIHHCDNALNTTTAFRIHIVEILSAALLKAGSIFLLGLNLSHVAVYETLMMFFVLMHHANIELQGEKWLGKLFIVPYLHRTHHSTERREHDNNYGAVFSIWDRLFGTLLEIEPRDIGIKESSPKNVFGLIKYGFQNTTTAQQQIPVFEYNVTSMVAEAAYYKAEKRGFNAGNDLNDWFEAEVEINRMLNEIRPLPNQRKETNSSNCKSKLLRYFPKGIRIGEIMMPVIKFTMHGFSH